MTELNVNEAGAVQFPMVRHAAEIGWTPLPPGDALALRGGEAGLLFRSEVENALRRFNAWMTDDAVRSVVENLQALPPTIEGNRQMLAWLRGERQWYDEAEQRHRQIRLIDFNDPSANVLHVTWEWRLKPPARKGNRADMMFVINSVPVAIVEHKNPTDADAIERGAAQPSPLLRRIRALALTRAEHLPTRIKCWSSSLCSGFSRTAYLSMTIIATPAVNTSHQAG